MFARFLFAASFLFFFTSPPVIEEAVESSEPAHVEVHPRDAYNWELATHGYYEKRGKYSRAHQARTREVIKATAKRVKASDDAQAFLLMIAMRESSLRGTQSPFDRRGIVHRLSPDKESASTAWKRQAKRYAGNPAYERSVDWMSFGPYGHNSPLFLHTWDRMGDPRMLGDTVIATLTELRVMRKKLSSLHGHALCPVYTQEGGIKVDYKGRKWRVGVQKRDANGKVIRERVKLHATWATLHRAVQGGKLCPAWEHDERAAWYDKRFRARAAKYGIDPDAEPTTRDLGKEPAGVDQYELWAQIWSSLGSDVLDGSGASS